MKNVLRRYLSVFMVVALLVTSFALPVSAETTGEVLTVKEALALPLDTENVQVQGTIAYFATTYGNPILHSVVDGEVYAINTYKLSGDFEVGDVVKVTGTFASYNGVAQMVVDSYEVIEKSTGIDPLEVTIEDIKTDGLNMISRFVKIKDVTLGEYNGGGGTTISDATGEISIYKAAPYPVLVEEGDVVDVYAVISAYKTSLQLSTGTPEANGFNIYDVVTDTKAPLLTLNEVYPKARASQDYTITVKAQDNKGVKKVAVTYDINGMIKKDQEMTFDALEQVYTKVISGDQLPMSATEFKFTITATDTADLATVSEEILVAVDNAPGIMNVVPARGSSVEDTKTPTIAVELINEGDNAKVTLTLTKDGNVVASNKTMVWNAVTKTYDYTTSPLVDGVHEATVTVLRSDKATTSTTWKFTAGKPENRALFGQLHAHTAEYSDGSGTLLDSVNYLKSIKASDNVQFISITDHSNYFDTTAAPNEAGALNDRTLMTPESLDIWNTYKSTMEDFNTENIGELAMLPGFEMTWSGGPGHINTFNSDGLISRNNTDLNSKSNDAGLIAYYDELIKNTDPLANLSQFNHPGSTFGTFSDFAYYTASYDNKMVAVEVGNGEGAIGSGGYFASYAEYTKALDKGWHVAPTNNQDNHKGRWGNSNTARTVIISDSLSSTGLLQGMKDMSVYATEDQNLNIDFTVNEQIMGSIIAEVPADKLQFVINIDDPDADDVIAKVEVVTNGGRVVASENFESNVVAYKVELPSLEGYYYVRVTQADKNIAVTAPIWIGQAPLVGISSLDIDTKMPVTNEALTLKTTLFNNEEASVTVKSIVYMSNNKVISSQTPNEEIISSGTFKHTVEYTPTAADMNTISVKATVLIDGQNKVFDQAIDLNVRDSEKLIYIGIDASHFNEYVKGNYKDSMGNFAGLAMDYDVRVVELNTSEELLAAAQNEKFAMLVFTPPTRRNGRDFLIGYKNYSDEEIAAIKAFSEAGKTVVVTGWSDNYENYEKYTDETPYTLPAEDQMSAQQNNLLKALGSSLRISDDEVNDEVKNGGQPQRLYLENHNLSNAFVEGVDVEEQVYSNYGGTTIYAVDSSMNVTTKLPVSVSPMVYGFESSISVDKDGDGTTGFADVMVPKYNDKYMVAASEIINNGEQKSTVIVAGSAFMSNFEIQVEVDSYATPAYSNFTIVENIVSSINPVVITDIEELHLAKENEKFTIEGIVTSNASGYDRNTAFFDTIYIQDQTAGINIFPVAGNIQAGQLVQITGTTGSYNGERQLNATKVTIVNDQIAALPEAKVVTAADVEAGTYLGSLVKLEGTIKSLEYANDVIESIYVEDSKKDVSRVFINGYITKDKSISNLTVGSKISAVGLSSMDADGARIRVRDRADILVSNPDGTMPMDKYESYVVMPGDFLWKIAKTFNTTWASLAEINKLKNPDLIIIGQKLLVPAKN